MKSDEATGDEMPQDKRAAWSLTREKILLFFGLALIAFEAINAEIRGGSFHYEFLICGLALCGVAIAGWGDKRSQ